MNMKLNHYEKVAGFFVLASMIGVIVVIASLAWKQGWFESRTQYVTVFDNADGVHAGTTVQMAGLKAGQVDEVELTEGNKIKVKFSLVGSFAQRVHSDSYAQLVRPFIIGERVLDVSLGSDHADLLPENSQILSKESMDFMTMLSGKNMGPQVERLSQAAERLGDLASAMLDEKRTGSLVKIFDNLEPLITSASTMTREFAKMGRDLNANNGMKVLISNLAALSTELNQTLPLMKEQNPQLARDMARLSRNLSQLTEDFLGVGVAMREAGPKMPQTTLRAIEALNETVVTLKALQKSFLLRGNVDEVKKEEKTRKPAGE